tara:strand:+ start:2051 stop:2707 length:657 start_codon:yes stop_codon:yes gene_type:complete
MLKSRKHVFWEAFFLTVVVFIFGLFLGVAYESNRIDEVNEYYAASEISLMDIFALNNMIELEGYDCGSLIETNAEFADRIFEEAALMENFVDAGRFSEVRGNLIHQRYDLLRTFLWINVEKARDKCGEDFSSMVYLYEYDTPDLANRATQKVWARILVDLKERKGGDIILIPIAVNTGLDSLQSLITKFSIENFPVVIVNNERVITELRSAEDLEKEF